MCKVARENRLIFFELPVLFYKNRIRSSAKLVCLPWFNPAPLFVKALLYT